LVEERGPQPYASSYCNDMAKRLNQEFQEPNNSQIKALTQDEQQKLHSINNERIDEANYCSVDSDCVNIGSICPYGCRILINRKHDKELCEVLSKASRCSFMCSGSGIVKCKNYKCAYIDKRPLYQLERTGTQ